MGRGTHNYLLHSRILHLVFIFYDLIEGGFFAVFFLNFSAASHQFAGLHLLQIIKRINKLRNLCLPKNQNYQPQFHLLNLQIDETFFMKCEFLFPFFLSGFLSLTFTIHRAAGEGGGYLFNSSLPIPPTSQTLRHQIDQAISAESSTLHLASSPTRTGNHWFLSASR